MKYIKRTCTAGDVIDVQKTYSPRYGRSLQKAGKTGKSREAVKRYNEKVAIRQAARYLNGNFVPGDLFVTWTYRRGERPTPETARKHRDKLLRDLRRYCRKNGTQLKYMGTSGIGKRGGIHHHFVINSIDPAVLRQLWPYGGLHIVPLYGRDYTRLAAYIYCQNKTGLDGKEHLAGDHWCRSKNLVRPQPKVEEISAREWREPPAPIKGYTIDIDSIETGYSPVTGIPYLFYRMVKIPPDSRAMTPDGRILKADAAARWLQQRNREQIRERHRAGAWDREGKHIDRVPEDREEPV